MSLGNLGLEDDKPHILKIEIPCYNRHREIDEMGGTSPYFFLIGFFGCSKGVTNYINLENHYDWVSTDKMMNEIELDIRLYIDGSPMEPQDDPIVLELEFSKGLI